MNTFEAYDVACFAINYELVSSVVFVTYLYYSKSFQNSPHFFMPLDAMTLLSAGSSHIFSCSYGKFC